MEEQFIQLIRSHFGECSICMSDFDENNCIPMQLNCQHSMCQKCIQANRQGKTIVCPFCKFKFTIAKNQIKDSFIQKDRARILLLDLLKQFTLKENRCCECSSKSCIAFCDKCAHCVCDKCLLVHQEICYIRKAFKASSSGSCTKENHGNYIFKYYCSTCNIHLCAICAFEDHRDEIHDVNDLFHRYKECALHINAMVWHLKIKIDATKENLRLLDSAEMEHFSTKWELEEVLDRKRDLNRIEKIFFKEKAKEASRNITNEIETRRLKYLEFSDNAAECCKIANDMQQDVIQFLSNEKFIKQKLSDLQEIDIDCDIEGLSCWKTLNRIYAIVHTPKENEVSFFSNVREMMSNFNRIEETMESNTCPTKKTGELRLHWQSIAIIVALLVTGIVFLIPHHTSPDSVLPVMFESSAFQRGCFRNSKFSPTPFDEGIQNCGQEDSFYIYKGAFVNRRYSFLKEECVGFHVQILPRKSYLRDDDYLFINIEFGVSTGTIPARSLSDYESVGKSSWSVLSNKLGHLYFNNSDGSIINLDPNHNGLYKYEICFYKTKVVKLWNEDVLVDSIRFRDLKKSTSLLPVFAIIRYDDVFSKILLTSPNINFNASTVHSDIFVSKDSRALSSHKIDSFYPVVQVKESFIHTEEIICTQEECCIPIDVHFSASKPIFYSEIGLDQMLQKTPHQPLSWSITFLIIMPCSLVKRHWVYSDSCLLIYGPDGKFQNASLIEEIWSPSKLIIYISSQQKIHVQSPGRVNVTISYERIDKSQLRLFFRSLENELIVFELGNHLLNDKQVINYMFLFGVSYHIEILCIIFSLLVTLNFVFGKLTSNKEPKVNL